MVYTLRHRRSRSFSQVLLWSCVSVQNSCLWPRAAGHRGKEVITFLKSAQLAISLGFLARCGVRGHCTRGIVALDGFSTAEKHHVNVSF